MAGLGLEPPASLVACASDAAAAPAAGREEFGFHTLGDLKPEKAIDAAAVPAEWSAADRQGRLGWFFRW